MKKLTLIFAAFGLAAFSAHAWAEDVAVVDAGTQESAGTEKFVDSGNANGDKSVADPTSEAAETERAGDKSVADPTSDGKLVDNGNANSDAGSVASLRAENAADEVVVIDENVDAIEKSETAKLIDEGLEKLEKEDAAAHWGSVEKIEPSAISAGTDFTVFGWTFHVDPTKSHAPLVEPLDLRPMLDKRVRIVLPDVEEKTTSQKAKSNNDNDDDNDQNLVDGGNSISDAGSVASLSTGTNSAGTGISTAGTGMFFSGTAGTTFYSTANVSLTNLTMISDDSTGTDSGDSTGTAEKTVAELNAEIIAAITENVQEITTDTIAADITKALNALKVWNALSTNNDCGFQGYPFFPTDFDFWEDKYEGKLWGNRDSSKRGPDYIFNPVKFYVDGKTAVTRYDADGNVIENVSSDKRYYYFIDQAGTSENESLRGAKDAIWAEFYPFDKNGKTVSSSDYRLITGDTSEIFQTVGSVIMIGGGLGSFTSTNNTQLLDIYKAVMVGTLDEIYDDYFKKLTVHSPVVYLSGIVSGTDNNGGESFVIIEGNETTLVFQKTENDRQYNELTVPIYFTGVLDFTGVSSLVVNDSVLINKNQSGYNANRTSTSTMTGSQSAPILIFGGALEGGKDKSIYIEFSNVIFKGECAAYEGDWYFAYGSNVVFAYATQTNNPIGVGDIYFRKSSWTLSVLSDNLEYRDIYAQISNDIILEGSKSETNTEDYTLRIFESARKRVFNESTNTFNRSYKILSGNISEGARGATKFVWGNRTSVPSDSDETVDMYKNMTMIFTGDNSKFGLFTGWANLASNIDANGYTTSREYASWDLGKTPYNMEQLGGVHAMPFIFGDGSAFTTTLKDDDGNDVLDDDGKTILNYAAIAGYGAFTTSLSGTNYSSVGFQYKSDVVVGNAFLGNIRLVNLDSGTITLTNTANELNAGIWVTGGGAIAFSDIDALGNGSINLLSGTLIYTGTDEVTFAKTLANKNSVFKYNSQYYCDTEASSWAIDIQNENAVFHWDASSASGSKYDTIELDVRGNDFTKLGAGTLEITNGQLLKVGTKTYIGASAPKAAADVYLNGGKLKLSGTSTLGDYRHVIMQGGSLESAQDLSLSSNFSYSTDADGKITFYDSTGTAISNVGMTAAEYNAKLEECGYYATIGLALSYHAPGEDQNHEKQAFVYNGKTLYYYNEAYKNYIMVGRDYVNETLCDVTDLNKIIEQLAVSYYTKGTTNPSDFYGGYLNGVAITDASKLVFNYNGQLVTGLTATGTSSQITTSVTLADFEVTSTSGITVPVGQTLSIAENGALVYTQNTLIEKEITDLLFANGYYTETIQFKAVQDQTSHEIKIGSTDDNGDFSAGTLTLNGGRLSFEFTYFERGIYETESINNVFRPSYTYLDLTGTLAVTGRSNIELTFSNGAILSRGFYLLIDSTAEISDESIANLQISGIVSDNDLTRQAIDLVRGDKLEAWLAAQDALDYDEVASVPAATDVSTTYVDLIPENANSTQLYLCITPGSAVLYWNTTNETWAQNEDHHDLSDNWKFNDSFDTTGFAKDDTNFYQNDLVIFDDVSREYDDDSSKNIVPGTKHIVTIEGDVNPLQLIVRAEQDEYVFVSSETNEGIIAGDVTLTKSGAGTLTIYTSNLYTGGTEISAGTVNALAERALGTGSVLVEKTGVLNVGAAGMNDDGNGYLDENGNAFTPVENVLYGEININVHGTVNIYAQSTPNANSTVHITGDDEGGGILNAYAANALGSVAVTVSGGELHAFVDNVFSGNAVVVRGSDETEAGVKAKVFGEATGSLNNATFDVWGDGIIYAKAESIGNADTTINLYGNTREGYRAGMIVIAADNALDDVGKVSFNMGGVIKVEQGNYDISNFTAWEWQSATGAEIKVGDASVIEEKLAGTTNSATGTAFTEAEIAEESARLAAASSLTISSTNMVAASTKIIHKTGTGTLIVNMDFQENNPDLTKFMGDFYFDDETDLDGKVIFDFGTAGTAENHLTYAGTLKGAGASVEFTGTYGEVNETYAHWFENTRIVNMTNVTDATGTKISNGQLYANETLIHMTVDEIHDLKHSTRFDAGDLVLQALPTENGVYRIGNIVTSSADSRYDVEIKAVNADGYIVASQNLCDSVFDGKFVDNTVTTTTTDDDGNAVTTTTTYNISIDKYGEKQLTLANNNSSSGTLHIYEGSVQIGNGGLTGDWGGNIIAEAGTELHFNFANYTDETESTVYIVELFGGSDSTTFSGEGKIIFENGNFKLYNSSAFEAMAGTDGQIVIESGATVVFDYSLDVAAGTAATLNGNASMMLIAGGLNLYENENISAGEDFTGTLILAGISDENVVKANSDGTNVTIDGNAEYSAFIDNSFSTETDELTTSVHEDSVTKTDIGELFPEFVDGVDSTTNTELLGGNDDSGNDGNGDSSIAAQSESAEVQTLSVAANLVSLSAVSLAMISDDSANDILEVSDSDGNDGNAGTDSLLALDLTNATEQATLIIDLGNVSLETLLDNAHNGITAIGIAASSVDESVFDDVELSEDGTAITLVDGVAFSGTVELKNAESLNITASAYDATTGVLYVVANQTAIPEPSLFGFLSGIFSLLLATSRRSRRNRR